MSNIHMGYHIQVDHAETTAMRYRVPMPSNGPGSTRKREMVTLGGVIPH